LCTVIADVSGKGISAALFMASAITVVRQYAKLGYSPSKILFHTNNTLCCNNPEQMFLTVFVGIYDNRTRKFAYANAGHNPPYLISDKLRSLDDSKGVAIGVFEDEVYEEREVELKEGDTVFLYTDGVSEAVSRDKKFFGTDRLEQILEQKSKEQCVVSVLEGVRNFAQNTPQSDDITMLSFGILPSFRIRVDAKLKNLEAVQRFILEVACIAHDLRKKICLAVEEIFVNVCSYAYGSEQGSVEIIMTISDQVLVKFYDSGRAFNPLEDMVDVENYDIDTQVGGMGRLIAFGLADQVYYEYSGGSNILTLIFTLKKEDLE
ncbi:MAG: SpoIIE family protein phosphatase, partial [Lachnospiraceae bacterium]|nr:SpoIIE family protein phosphatase [Lachnospiraceae bacterium]